MLPAIAAYALGNNATLIMAVAMLFSCLTTAIALNNLFARYLCSTLRLNDNRFIWVLATTTGVSFVVSLLDFKGISAFLSPILELTYPAVIALTAMCIFIRGKQKYKMMVFYVITVGMGGFTSLHVAN